MEPPTNVPNLLTYDAVSEAWRPEEHRAQTQDPTWNECDTVIYTEVSKMLAGQKTPEQAMKTAKKDFDEARTRVENLASGQRGIA